MGVLKAELVYKEAEIPKKYVEVSEESKKESKSKTEEIYSKKRIMKHNLKTFKERKEEETQIPEKEDVEFRNKQLELFLLLSKCENERLNAQSIAGKEYLENMKKEKGKELGEAKAEMKKVENENVELKKKSWKIPEYQKKIELLYSEIERLKKLVKDREGEIEIVRKKYMEAAAQNKSGERAVTIEEVEMMKEKYRKMEEEMAGMGAKDSLLERYEQNIAKLGEELGQSQKTLKEKTEEVERIKKKNMELIQKEKRIVELEEKQKANRKMIDDLSGQNAVQEAKLTALKAKSMNAEYEKEIALQKQHVERLSAEVKQKKEEIDQWKLLSQSAMDKEKKIVELEEQLTLKFRDLDILKQKYGQLEQNLEEIKGQREEKDRISKLMMEVERVHALKKQKDEEIEGWHKRYSDYILKEKKIAELEGDVAKKMQEVEKLKNQCIVKDTDICSKGSEKDRKQECSVESEGEGGGRI